MDHMLGVKISQLPKNFEGAYRFPMVSKEREVGLEFEIEGGLLPTQEDLKYHWKVTHDGSLRGPSAEYVLKNPVSFKQFKEKSLPYLTKCIKKKKSKVNLSNRCSTHVHVNVQDLYGYQVLFMGVLYYMFEDLLTALYRDDRKGNLFCVGSTESSDITRMMVMAAKTDFQYLMHDKYAAVNFSSIAKYGSLEFRALQGTINQEEVNTWISYLLSLRDYVKGIRPENIPNILRDVSVMTPVVFFQELVPVEIFAKCLKHFDGDEQRMTAAIYSGVDRMQPVFYEPEWDNLLWWNDMSISKYVNAIVSRIKDKNIHSLWAVASGELREALNKTTKLKINTATLSGTTLRELVEDAPQALIDAPQELRDRAHRMDVARRWGGNNEREARMGAIPPRPAPFNFDDL